MRIEEQTEKRILKNARPCPFCFSTRLALIDATPDGSGKYWSVGCLDCHAGGPSKSDGHPEKAVELWNGTDYD